MNADYDVAANPDEIDGNDGADVDDILEVVWRALGDVYDPELCLDVVSLGLVYGVHVENGRIIVEMTLTTPGCPASQSFPEVAQSAIKQASGISDVEIRLVWDPPWSPQMINDDAARLLGFR
ncbi:MAG: iron-sulfur cluster assembly protein [Actinobacteria bacterium]|nr:iron-sulfur cluster assembly protein [Actinomycetota bacterium]MCL5885426.1 iron-sulfur cluster assembly protein [Actinomycetota bacterium]